MDTTPSAKNSLSKWIGLGFAAARDALAKCLLRMHLGPTALTAAGLIFTAAAAVCLAVGAGAQQNAPRLWAGLFLVLCGAADILDGAVARLGGKATKFGAFLDSAVDRYSDVLLFLGIGFYYAWQQNLTYQVLAVVAMANALIISYTKARAEDFIPSCSVGYWQRGERSAALTIAAFAGTMPAVLWELAVFPFFTGLRRILFTRRAIQQTAQPDALQQDTSDKLADDAIFDRCRRGTIIYDIVTAAYIAFIIFAPITNDDIFRSWLN